ncbi:fungal-specific transcription factor domain-domain-containing protein [Catenaria anguillulae PL171]|uniref:Fungal-specific transcription factor domain-domain-containing protein n=1 Tax=Catenaria anguillulae PL171 TaxID=765915 RepID=A0A1Y2HDZ7_9FUNG|nr:fungal-specific transcription factor domain-domain-containing protein [Catenaria anguillulae PL171]
MDSPDQSSAPPTLDDILSPTGDSAAEGAAVSSHFMDTTNGNGYGGHVDQDNDEGPKPAKTTIAWPLTMPAQRRCQVAPIKRMLPSSRKAESQRKSAASPGRARLAGNAVKNATASTHVARALKMAGPAFLHPPSAVVRHRETQSPRQILSPPCRLHVDHHVTRSILTQLAHRASTRFSRRISSFCCDCARIRWADAACPSFACCRRVGIFIGVRFSLKAPQAFIDPNQRAEDCMCSNRCTNVPNDCRIRDCRPVLMLHLNNRRPNTAATKPHRSNSTSQPSHLPQPTVTVATSLNADHPPPTMCRADLLKEVNELAEKMTVVVSVDEHGGHAHISNHGHAGALHLFRNWTRTFTPNARDGLVYIPDLVCCPPRPAVLAMHKILFPAPAFVDMLVEYFFDHVHPFLPFVSRGKIQSQRVSEAPSYALMYSLLAASAQQFERRYRVGPMHGVLVSHLLLTRAKALVQPMLSSPTPCLLNIQALLLIEMADRESVRGAPWLISGMAIRMALDIGLNLGIPESVKEMNLVSVPVWSKTWIYCCIVDSLNSFQTGRSHMISDADSVQDLDECILNDHNSEKYGDSELIPSDHFFVWLFKLFEITGKIGRTITSIRIRRNLPYSLPELHSLLSKFRSNLPKSLVYDFERPNRNSVFAVHLNLLYLGTVIFLYRTIFACNLLVHSPLRVEYMRILESSTDAILTIFGAHLDTVHLAPLPLGYAFDLIYTVCVILMSQGQPPLPQAHTQDAASSSSPSVNGGGTSNGSQPGSPMIDPRNKPKAVRILSQCLQLLDSLAMAQPLLRRHAALGKELLESITGTVQDCDRDRRKLIEHLEVIKASEAVVAEWSADPLVERREADVAFTAFLSVPRSTLSYFGGGASGGSKASAMAWQRAAAAASASSKSATPVPPDTSATSVTAAGVHQLAASSSHTQTHATSAAPVVAPPGFHAYMPHAPPAASSHQNAQPSSSSAAAAAILAGMTASEMITAMRAQQHQHQHQGAAATASASSTLLSLYNPTTGQQEQYVAPPGTVFTSAPSLASSTASLMYPGQQQQQQQQQQQPMSTSPPTHGLSSTSPAAYLFGHMHAQPPIQTVLDLPTFPAELLTNDVAMLDVAPPEGQAAAATGGGGGHAANAGSGGAGGDPAANQMNHLGQVGNALGQVVNVAGFLHPGNGFNFAFHE